VLGLLAAASRREEWLALGALLVGRLVNALPVAVGNPDLRYTIQSVVVVTWAVAASMLLAWRSMRRDVLAWAADPSLDRRAS
jgi:hypothetical protein